MNLVTVNKPVKKEPPSLLKPVLVIVAALISFKFLT